MRRSLLTTARDVGRRLAQQYGTASLKTYLWNREFAGSRWRDLEDTCGDFVYPVLERYARGGSILDLGCGSGNTGCEVALESYRHYLGVDVSSEAIRLAERRSIGEARSDKNRYACADLLTYEPEGHFDVILLRDSIYYVPLHRIPHLLRRYAAYLTTRGVFIVRMYDGSGRYSRTVRLIRSEFRLVEQVDGDARALVLVFRPGSGA